jgi:hypothetical protein
MNWLINLTKEEIETGKFPLNDILHNSLYYPSCGFDGGVVKDCNTVASDLGIVSFIYCDYATGKDAFLEAQNTFLGYHLLGCRDVTHSELIPNGWNPILPPGIDKKQYMQYKADWKPFIMWSVFERDKSRDKSHGPDRFSILYLGGEGVATYNALYWTNNISARAIAIIQPGTAFGMNWTNFCDENGALAWMINNNPAGKPEIFYYGGYGTNYDNFNWSNYKRKRIIENYYGNYYGKSGEVGIWENSI